MGTYYKESSRFLSGSGSLGNWSILQHPESTTSPGETKKEATQIGQQGRGGDHSKGWITLRITTALCKDKKVTVNTFSYRHATQKGIMNVHRRSCSGSIC